MSSDANTKGGRLDDLRAGPLPGTCRSALHTLETVFPPSHVHKHVIAGELRDSLTRLVANAPALAGFEVRYLGAPGPTCGSRLQP